MEILVFGAGAVGSLFGGLLSRSHHVILVGRADHVEAIRSRGLRISGKTRFVAKPRAVTRVPGNARPDLVFVTTKAYDTANAMRALRRLGNRSVFITLQNGLGNAETIAKTAHRVVAGTTAQGVTFVGPGEVRHAGVGDTVIGAWTPAEEANLVPLRDLLVDAGIRTRLTSDIRTELWSKLVVNAALNPIAALAGVPNGAVVRDKRLAALSDEVCREASAVARAAGARIDAAELRQRTRLVARRTAANRGSMLQDLDHHRRTEIDAITGAIVRSANRHRIPVPFNRALYALVRARERSVEATVEANLPDQSL